MCSLAAAKEPLGGVSGLVFFGFPLHPPGRPGVERAKHLSEVNLPMLFLQGTRDKLADLHLLTPICKKIPSATLSILEGADHSFHMTKASGVSGDHAIQWLITRFQDWLKGLEKTGPSVTG
jgi:predicted alpha/beta-hydrolase family hydrolase